MKKDMELKFDSPQVQAAYEIAASAHADQVDKAEKDFAHVERYKAEIAFLIEN